MKIQTSFDFGETVSISEVKISINLEATIADAWALPDIREVLAENIEPLLRQFKATEGSIARAKERILLSGKLAKEVGAPYQYDTENHLIVDMNNRAKQYSVRDYLEGKVPDLPK